MIPLVEAAPKCVLAAIYETLHVGDTAAFKASDILAGGTTL
ncbi:unnamed protein product, partial [marine sediment metagenome]